MNDIAAMMRYERAGDQHVGRIASGLPTEEPDFAILPPMFHTTDQGSRERVNAIVKLVFPYASTPRTRAVVEVGLASVIYHEQLLREVMPTNHPLFRTTLFLHSGFVQTLRQHVTIESHGRTATRIPPHVCLLKQMSVFPWRGDSSCNDRSDCICNDHYPTRISGREKRKKPERTW